MYIVCVSHQRTVLVVCALHVNMMIATYIWFYTLQFLTFFTFFCKYIHNVRRECHNFLTLTYDFHMNCMYNRTPYNGNTRKQTSPPTSGSVRGGDMKIRHPFSYDTSLNKSRIIMNSDDIYTGGGGRTAHNPPFHSIRSLRSFRTQDLFDASC